MTTIREHNATRYGRYGVKSDYIVGITLDGAFYCADCVEDHDAYAPNEGYGPNPVFADDEHDFTCDDCFRCSNGLSPLACVAQCRDHRTEV